MTLKNGFGKWSLLLLFYQLLDEKIKTWTLRFSAKENPNMENALFDWPVVLQYDVKAISRKFFDIFHPRVRLTNQKPRAFVSVRQTNQIAVFPFFVVSVMFARFHFKAIRKSLQFCAKTIN